jgi:cysteinyl-tRNA synthetase
MCDTLGLLQPEYFERKKLRFLTKSLIKQDEIEDLIRRRDQARQNKNWPEADRLRDELSRQGILLEDTPNGTVWKVK